MKQIDITGKKKKLNEIIGKHQNYKNFSRNRKRAFEYADTIGVRVCPYCNINYTYTVTSAGGNPVVRPDFDHFEPKSVVTKKSLDPENLIPSCQQCNSRLKLKKLFSKATHVHPFFDDFDSLVRIDVVLSGPEYLLEENLTIEFNDRVGANSSDCVRAKRNIDDFKLFDRYQHHKNEVVEIFRKVRFYSSGRLKELDNLLHAQLPLATILFNDLLCDINSVSLGKLKKDITSKYCIKRRQ